MLKNKKIELFMLITIFAATLLVGCGSKTQIEKAQAKIVSIGEQFLDYELTREEAKKQLDSITIPSTEDNGDSFLSVDKDYLEYLIIKTGTNDKTYDEIKEKIQHIKKGNYK